MQIDMNLIPQFDVAAVQDVASALPDMEASMGLAELFFFIASYLWERNGGEGGAAILESFF